MAQMFVYSWMEPRHKLKEKSITRMYLVYASKDADSDEFAQEKDAPVFNGANI